ncbi:MAG: lysA [Naasia sp.]|uniref:diaminopimelate decarboxylase n=1 Tax=Naasia sp. TaxID=2546198 RepID=UPI00263605FC|nr:diaminopimelate decarboxylase [Naasia sp.]MCU1570030.1 lysA [Naasia sp.]
MSEDDVLLIGGCSVEDLASTYGTPLYVYDEAGLRAQARALSDGLRARWPNSEVLFASKSFPAVAMYRLAAEEGLSVDVAGLGELQFALAARVPADRLYLHGNAKSDDEIRLAVETHIAAIIVDNTDDLHRIERLAAEPQNVLLRVIPGVAPDVHASQSTGGQDSKFGVPLDQLDDVVRLIARLEHVTLIGIHLHIGSQVLETEPFVRAVEAIGRVGEYPVYNIGGGLGVQYTFDEDPPSVEAYLDAVVAAAARVLPAGAKLLIEPGRSIVARAGVTLYRVNTVKRSGKSFVAVDGGMADNMDIALTGQRYEALIANRVDGGLPETVDLVGRQCESGDRLRADIALNQPVVGDLVVMTTTGAYAYTMANNYNGALRPAVVFCADGKSRVVVARESIDDLLRLQEPAAL